MEITKRQAKSILFILIALAICFTACETTSKTVLDAGGDSGDQVLIINREGSEDPASTLGADVNELSRINLWRYSSDTWGASLWTVTDHDSMIALDYGTASLDNFQLEELDTNNVRYWLSSEDPEDPEFEDRYIPYVFQVSSHRLAPLGGEAFTGTTTFSVSGSPEVADLTVEIDLPDQYNEITNLDDIKQNGVDPNQDLTLTFATPIGTGYARVALGEIIEENLSTQYRRHVTIQVVEETDTMVIPAAELQNLMAISSGSTYWLGMWDSKKVDEIEIRGHNGNLLPAVDVVFSSSQNTQFSFK